MVTTNNANNRAESLGPAERIINTLLAYTDHVFHGRPGVVVDDPASPVGKRWKFVTHKHENGQFNVYELTKAGKKTNRVLLGSFRDPPVEVRKRNKDGKEYFALKFTSKSDRKVYGMPAPGRVPNVVGEYREPGIFPEVATWYWRQIAEIYKLDNEFVARWASYAFGQEHRDLKVMLAAFMLIQSRKGAPIYDEGKVAFWDDDYRDIGEAMMLAYDRKDDNRRFSPKQLLMIRDVLTVPAIAEINRELGFGMSARTAPLGRWPAVVTKYLRNREENPKLLDVLLKAGFRTQLIALARHVGYKPTSVAFFNKLRWKQAQAKDGRRTMLDTNIAAAETWAGMTEGDVCQTIITSKYDWKRIAGLLPPEVGVTRAVIAAAIEANALSNKDLVNLTPTLEELGLLTDTTKAGSAIRARWEAATKAATDQRAAHIAQNVKSKELRETLEAGADDAAKKAVEEVTRNLRVYFMIDVSGSMQPCIEVAKRYIAKLVQAIPLDRFHLATFNTAGIVRSIKMPTTVGVEHALAGIRADGGTDYGAGVRCLSLHKPNDDEDVIFIFAGDEAAHTFEAAVRGSGLRPMAFGLIFVQGSAGRGNAVTATARNLGIPCFELDNKMFEDAYAIPRTLRALVSATPVGLTAAGVARRETLVDRILKTELLQKPAWA